jgi:hypothetical protein
MDCVVGGVSSLCLDCTHSGRRIVESIQVILMMYGYSSFMYSNPCTVSSTLHSICSSMEIGMCSEFYEHCIHKYGCTYDLTLSIYWSVALRVVMAIEKCRPRKYLYSQMVRIDD